MVEPRGYHEVPEYKIKFGQSNCNHLSSYTIRTMWKRTLHKFPSDILRTYQVDWSSFNSYMVCLLCFCFQDPEQNYYLIFDTEIH